MSKNNYCRECDLEIKPYKQALQEDDTICEFCVIAHQGLTEYPTEEDFSQ